LVSQFSTGNEESELGDLGVKKQSWLLPGGSNQLLLRLCELTSRESRIFDYTFGSSVLQSLVRALAFVFIFFAFI